MPPPRPPLPPRSLPGCWVRAAPPRAGHDGSCSSPPYARRGVERGGGGGADYVSQQALRCVRMRSWAQANKNLPFHSSPPERRCIQPESARGNSGASGLIPAPRGCGKEAAAGARRSAQPLQPAVSGGVGSVLVGATRGWKAGDVRCSPAT